MRHRRKQRKLRRCNISGLVIFDSRLDAEIVLAKRVWADKGEKRTFACGSHWHLTAEAADPGRNHASA